jgi:SAM-dependent methyltransferase
VLLGAVLLFTMEPMIGRRLSALHGAGHHVWNTAMMYYSGALLAGYFYAHHLAPRLGRGHLGVIAAALCWVLFEPAWQPIAGGPVVSVLLALLLHSALPFVVLASTSVVAQQWLVASRDPGSRDPYWLYAASNAGSLVGLLSYPLLLEPLLGLSMQRLLWIALWFAFALLAVWLAPRGEAAARADELALEGDDADDGPAVPAPPGYWLVLSAAPSMALLAATNLIANDVGSVPLAWAAPLAVYLSTFMLAFRRRPTSGSLLRRHRGELAVVGCIACTWELAAPLLLLFGIALAAHSELHRVRPPAEGLSRYYLYVGTGGWAGAAFVSLLAPVLFDDLYEWPLSLALVAVALLIARRRLPLRDADPDARRQRLLRAVAVAAAAGTVLSFAARSVLEGPAERIRNHYGVYRVTGRVVGISDAREAGQAEVRFLMHGTTVHGLQRVGGEGRREPLGYYHPSTALGDALGSLEGVQRGALIGLGSGTVAAYFDEGDEVVFYELDPDGEAIARTHFDYLAETGAALRFVPGDARISLGRDPLAPDGSFDLVFVDAFSGDAVPSHLLTREAMQLYLRKLRSDGLLLVHFSSRFYDLAPVLRAATEALGVPGAYRISAGSGDALAFPTRAYVVSRDGARIAAFEARGWRPDREIAPVTLWTDDYVNVLAPLARRLTARWSGAP